MSDKLFQEEVFAEADRLDKEESEKETIDTIEKKDSTDPSPQSKIDALRAKVAELSRKLEGDLQ